MQPSWLPGLSRLPSLFASEEAAGKGSEKTRDTVLHVAGQADASMIGLSSM